MPLYWFKGPVGEPFQFQCGPDGIHVPGLAEEVKLKARPLKLNGVVVDFDSSSGYLSLQDAQEFIQGLGGSTETAIPVDGQPAGAAAGGTTGQALSVYNVLGTTYPIWRVEACSSSTNTRPYAKFQKQSWQLASADIRDYIHEKLGNLQLTEDVRGPEPRGLPPMMSEAECNARFETFYGQPIARILSLHWGKDIEFHINAPSLAAMGCPDFAFFKRVGSQLTELVVGEGKTPSVLKLAATMFPKCTDETLDGCAKQICDYVRLRDMTYGWLTCLNATYFIRRVAEHTYEFTPAVYTDSTNPTVLEMLLYIVLKQHEVGRWPPRLPTGASSLPDSDDVPGPLQPTELRPPSTAGRPVTRGFAAQQGSSSAAVVPSSGVQHCSHPEEALEWTRACLGAGQCGYVVEGRLYGMRSAIKAIDLSKQLPMLELLVREVSIYEHLAALQGKCIPALLGYGLWHEGTTYFVATSVVEGEHPGHSTYGASEAAVKALRSIHGMGVLHGDIRRENLLVTKHNAGWQVWLLDFGHSAMSSNAAAQAEEVEQLMRLFGDSVDSAAGDATMGDVKLYAHTTPLSDTLHYMPPGSGRAGGHLPDLRASYE